MAETEASPPGLGPIRPLEVHHRRTGTVSLLTVGGELDVARCPRLWVAINEVLRTAPRTVIIDLCAVRFIDSTGLALLLNARRRTSTLGIDLKLACDVERTLGLLRITRLAREFEIYPDARAAMAACEPDASHP
jgi:anti-anti-sigma factor